MPPKVLPELNHILQLVQNKSRLKTHAIDKLDVKYLTQRYDMFHKLCYTIYKSNIPNEKIYTIDGKPVLLHIIIEGVRNQDYGWTLESIDIFNMYIINIIWNKYAYMLDNTTKK